jgi:hypothetical protein
MTGGDGGGIAFQGRFADTGANSSGLHGDVTASPPHWVKIVRTGNELAGYHSDDGQTWELFTDTSPDNSGGEITNPQPVEGLPDTVLIGLFVTSHADGENRTYTFDNIDLQGDLDGVIVSEDIDSVSGNSAEPVYVALEDSTGAVAAVTHPYPAATQITTNRAWTIPLSAFEGVDVTQAAKLYVGVGNGEPGGKGAVTFTDIKVVEGASAGNIIWVSDAYDENPDGIPDDQGFVDLLETAGYTVDYAKNAPGNGYWRTLDDDKIATLNATDLIIVSRNSNSGDYADGDEVAQWNSITTPIILNSTHIVRNSRWKWLDTGDTSNHAPIMVLADGTTINAVDPAVGQCSFALIEDAGNGTVLATGEGLVWIAEWEAGVEFYDGAGEIAGGPRVFFVAGSQEVTDAVPPVGRGEMNLTPEGVAVFLSVVDDLIPAKMSDITAPGDIIQGVPNDGDWPGGEYPALSIDNNVNTKFLHFKGDFDPDPGTGGAGIRITPLDGPSVVTGLSFTTANDVPGRDPIAFRLSGSNDGIDGPYELIAEGDIVDFAGEAEWPRFTKNETPITFANGKAYANYELIFTAIRGPVGGSVNSMQIAEIELLGTLGEAVAAGYMYDGDSLEGWDHDNNSDAWDGTGPGEGNPGGAALLSEDGVTFLRIQDIGDPRSLGITDPSNRKVYLTQQIDRGLDGAHMEFKLRVATTPPLDDQVSGDPWPEGGIGYHIRDGGKGMVGIAETGVGQISFSLAKAGEIEGIDTDALVVNGLLGTESSGDVDTGDAATPNSIAIDDATAWNTITVDIAAGGAGTHVLTISVNGGEAASVDVTAGDALDGDNIYVAIGSSGTGGTTAFDVDYVSVK